MRTHVALSLLGLALATGCSGTDAAEEVDLSELEIVSFQGRTPEVNSPEGAIALQMEALVLADCDAYEDQIDWTGAALGTKSELMDGCEGGYNANTRSVVVVGSQSTGDNTALVQLKVTVGTNPPVDFALGAIRRGDRWLGDVSSSRPGS